MHGCTIYIALSWEEFRTCVHVYTRIDVLEQNAACNATAIADFELIGNLYIYTKLGLTPEEVGHDIIIT